MGPSFLAIVLLAVALALFFAEVFIPSGGMILAGAIVCVVCSIWSAQSAWWVSNQPMFWGFVAISLILIPTSIASAISLWPMTTLGKKSEPPTLEEVTPYLEEQRRLEQLLGQVGVTETHLNPGGIVRIQERRIHCRSEGMIVSKGTPVTIIAVEGNGVIVREAAVTVRNQPETPKVNDDSLSPAANPLDFDVPTS